MVRNDPEPSPGRKGDEQTLQGCDGFGRTQAAHRVYRAGAYGLEVSPPARYFRPCCFSGADLAYTDLLSGSCAEAGRCRGACAPDVAGAAETARPGTFHRRARGVS